MKFHIITAMYNEAAWIEQNIQMIMNQTYDNFQCILIDDKSNDHTVNVVSKLIKNDSRFKVVVNKAKKYKTQNVVEGISIAEPQDEDVILIVDGDDRLAHHDVLKSVCSAYQSKNCWMTYGSYANNQGERDEICKPYDPKIIEKDTFRKNKWRASHLKTFKYKLWKLLKPDVFYISEREYHKALMRAFVKGRIRTWNFWRKIDRLDLLDESAQFIRRVDDKAFTYPMLEMVGEKAHFIEEILYITRVGDRSHCDSEPVYGYHRSEKWHTRLIRNIIEHKEIYSRMTI